MNKFPFPTPLVFGHRGYSSLATENTLPAFELIRKHRIQAVELDVHLCASGELVVIHDFNTGRVFERSLSVAGTDYSVLKKLKVNEKLKKSGTLDTIAGLPRLDDVIDILGKNVIYDIELKSYRLNPMPFVKQVHALLENRGVLEQSIISSFNPMCIRCSAKLGHPYTAYIYSNEKDVYFFLRRGEARSLSKALLFKPNYLDLEKWWNRKMLVKKPELISTWTVDSAVVAEKFYNAGVSAFISNNPLPVKQHLDSLLHINK